MPRVFAQGNAIAAQLAAVFGVVHLVWHEGSLKYCVLVCVYSSTI
jgi:hypothetical protein